MARVSVTLLFPNDTSVKLDGDQEVVSQIIGFIGSQTIGFIKHDYIYYDEASDMSGWDLEALKKLIDQGKKHD